MSATGEPDRPAERVKDPGLPAERTRLAWRRTALAGTAVALLTIRLAATGLGGPAGAALSAIAVFGWLAVLIVAFRRLRGMGPDRPAPVGRALGLAALIIGYAVLGVALVFLGAPG